MVMAHIGLSICTGCQLLFEANSRPWCTIQNNLCFCIALPKCTTSDLFAFYFCSIHTFLLYSSSYNSDEQSIKKHHKNIVHILYLMHILIAISIDQNPENKFTITRWIIHYENRNERAHIDPSRFLFLALSTELNQCLKERSMLALHTLTKQFLEAFAAVNSGQMSSQTVGFLYAPHSQPGPGVLSMLNTSFSSWLKNGCTINSVSGPVTLLPLVEMISYIT